MFGISIRQWLAIFGLAFAIGLIGLWQIYEHRFEIFELRFAPTQDFGELETPPAPDYTDMANWAAWPGQDSFADLVPKGMTGLPLADRKADVFYVHATTYDKPLAWNADIRDTKLNRATDQIYTARHASMFNGCCRIFAPRYRQGTLFASRRHNDNTLAAMDVAYADIRAAFLHYMETENEGRPFILASHSQGTSHVERLLYEEVVGKPYQAQLVAAYLVGYWLPAELPARTGIPPCSSRAQTGCIAAWDTYTQERKPFDKMDAVGHWDGEKYSTEWSGKKLCVNPVSWRNDTVDAMGSKGALAMNYDHARRIDPAHQSHLLPLADIGMRARCSEDGKLYVPLFSDDVFRYKVTMPSYHRFDMEFFYGDIWANATLRVNSFVTNQP